MNSKPGLLFSSSIRRVVKKKLTISILRALYYHFTKNKCDIEIIFAL